MMMAKLCTLLVFPLFFTFTLVAQKDAHTCAAVKSKKKQVKSNTLSVGQIAETERYDVHFYHLDLNMTNTTTALSGTVEIHATSREVLDSALFELFQSFTISDIQVNGNTVAYNRVASAIKVPVNVMSGEDFIISISYSGTPPTQSSNPLGGAGMSNASSPSWGNQVTWSLSESFCAFEWFPCKQSLKDKADSVYVDITVPSNCKAGSNGLLVAEQDLGDGTTKFQWRHFHPIDYYLISVAVAEYVDYTIYANPIGAINPIPIQNFIYNNPNTLLNFQNDIDETVDFIEYFSEVYGLYPFADEKYGHCMAPLSGGMEHQTMTTQGFFEKTLTAHELGHQWWGDYVTCGSWADIWVNEGFASYSEYLMLAEMYPGEEIQDMASRHSTIMSQLNGSVWVEDSLNEDRIFSSRLTYDKGAAIVHTFRYLLNNDDQFFQGLRNFLSDHANSTALGTDVQTALENSSGKDLSAAFEEWYYGEGYPTYSARWNMVGDSLFVTISQTTSVPSVTPFFTNDLDIKFQRTGLSDTIIRFPISEASNSYAIAVGSTISNLSQIDPENWIINKTGSITHDALMGHYAQLVEENKNNISIYPNPSSDFVEVVSGSDEEYLVKIIDVHGKLCYSSKVKKGEKIDISAFDSGLLLFQIESLSGEEVRRKIVRK